MVRLSIATALFLAVSILAVRAQTKKTVPSRARQPFTVVEATIPDMQAALKSGRVTSHELVQQYLERIATYEVGTKPWWVMAVRVEEK